MKLKLQFTFLSALLAFGASGIASAEAPTTTDAANLNVIEAKTNDQLKAAFENFSAQHSGELSGLSGPTWMSCANSSETNLETCVVRLIGNSGPAALAQN